MTEEKKVEEHVDRTVTITGDDVPAGTDNQQSAPTPDSGTKNEDRPAEGSTKDQQETVEQTKDED